MLGPTSPGIGGIGRAIDRSIGAFPISELEASGAALQRAQSLLPAGEGDSLDGIRECLAVAEGHRKQAYDHLLSGTVEAWQYAGSIIVAAADTPDVPGHGRAETPASGQAGNRTDGSPGKPSPPPNSQVSEFIFGVARLRERSNHLTSNFEAAAGRLDFAAMAVIPEGRGVPRSLTEFRFIPIVPIIPVPGKSMVTMGSECELPGGVYSTYSVNKRPYVDTQCAIGLVRGDWLVAVASGGIDSNGNLKIVQIQDVSGFRGKNSRVHPKGRFSTGLHDGFLWRDTLVNAWMEVARQTRVTDTIVLQCGKNNRWPEVNLLPEHPGYDGVARRMGFIKRSEDGDWEMHITGTPGETA